MDRNGARQPDRFDPARAFRLGGTERDRWLPYARIRELLDVRPGTTVVDFGAGTGAIAIPLAVDEPGVTVIAVDEQPAMLERLRAAAGPTPPANLLTSSGEAVAAASAVRILALNVLHEAGDAALVQMRDMLAADGVALVIDWRSDVERAVGPPAAHAYTEAEAAARLAAAGFAVTPGDAEGFPYHFVLEARRAGTGASEREATLLRLRALAGMRIAIDTPDGTFEGFVDVGAGADAVTILIVDRPGGDPSRALVADLGAILAIREA